MLRGGQHDQHGAAVAVGAQMPSSAEDAFAVLPQDLEAVISLSADPEGWIHDQALGPPLNPVEMANPDAACVTYHLSQSAYRSLLEQVWGTQSFAITWPADTAQLCAQPAGSTTSASSTVVPLSSADRAQAITTFDNMGLAMSNYRVRPGCQSVLLEIRFRAGWKGDVHGHGARGIPVVHWQRQL